MNLYKMWYTVTDFITAELWKYFQFATQTLGEFVPEKWYLNSVKPQFLY